MRNIQLPFFVKLKVCTPRFDIKFNFLTSIFFLSAEYDSNFQLVQKQKFKIPDHLMIHDWAFTDTHYIVFANRIKLDIPG